MKDFRTGHDHGCFPSVLAINASVPGELDQGIIAMQSEARLVQLRDDRGRRQRASLRRDVQRHGGRQDDTVSYNTGTAITDLVSWQVPVVLFRSGSRHAYVKAGRLKALGSTSARKSPLLPPDMPTIAETVPGYDMEVVYCLFAPAHTPTAIVSYLNQESQRVLKQPDVKERFMTAGIAGAAVRLQNWRRCGESTSRG